MHKRNKKTLVPLNFYRSATILSWSKRFFEGRSSLRFYSLLLMVFLLDLLPVLSLISFFVSWAMRYSFAIILVIILAAILLVGASWRSLDALSKSVLHAKRWLIHLLFDFFFFFLFIFFFLFLLHAR